jgi:hypothetical protein
MSYRGQNAGTGTIQIWNGSRWIPYSLLEFQQLPGNTARINAQAALVLNAPAGDIDIGGTNVSLNGATDANIVATAGDITATASAGTTTLVGLNVSLEASDPTSTISINSINELLLQRGVDTLLVLNTSTNVPAGDEILVWNAGGYNEYVSSLSNMGTITYGAEGNAGNSGAAAFAIDFSTLGQKVRCTLTGDAAISATFPGVGNYTLKLIQDGTGGRLPTVPASWRTTGASLDLGVAANATTIWNIYYDGTNAWVSSLPDAVGSVTVNGV